MYFVHSTAGNSRTVCSVREKQDSSGSLWACAVIEFGAYYIDLARYVLGFPPRTVKGLRRWILFYCLTIGYYGDNGYASLSPSGRASLKDPSVRAPVRDPAFYYQLDPVF